MDEKDKQNLAVSAEEQKAEEEANHEVNEDELRSKVSEEYGLDQDEDKELLDKLVAKEKLQHEKLSSAIKQKISWREKYQASAKNTVKDQQEETDVDAQIESKFKALMEERVRA